MNQPRQSLARPPLGNQSQGHSVAVSTLDRMSQDEVANGRVDRAERLHPLDVEIARAEEAYQLMLAADACLKSGADRLLLLLGFSPAHVRELRALSGPGGGYPPYSLRNIRRTLRQLRDERERASGSK
jgi:hypothetical protein